MKDDRLTLVYSEGSTRVELGKILANKSISIDDALRILGIDMDTFAEKQGWDGWDFECLYLVDAPETDPMVYSEGSTRVELGKILTNKSISIDDALRILGIDMDTFAEKQGWDGWDFECLYEYQCRDNLPCYYDQGVEYQSNVTLIPLAEYATMHGKAESSARRKAIRGGFKTAKKIGRNWVIDRDEPYSDLRKKLE